jgi:hypothetical protein
MYNYPEDTFTNAPINPTVAVSAYDHKQMYIGGSFTGNNIAGLARWTGTAWAPLSAIVTPWFFEGSVNTMLLTTEPVKPAPSGLPGWAIALITIASIVGAIVIVGAIGGAFYVYHKRSQNYETL